ncbi:pentapeptide repeat-containing protein [Persicobacter diffluens]
MKAIRYIFYLCIYIFLTFCLHNQLNGISTLERFEISGSTHYLWYLPIIILPLLSWVCFPPFKWSWKRTVILSSFYPLFLFHQYLNHQPPFELNSVALDEISNPEYNTSNSFAKYSFIPLNKGVSESDLIKNWSVPLRLKSNYKENFLNRQFDTVKIFSLNILYTKPTFSKNPIDSLKNLPSWEFSRKPTYFENKFHFDTDHQLNQFDSLPNFYWRSFPMKLDYSWRQFHSRVNYYKSNFDSLVNFSWCKFKNEVDFSESKFNNLIDFSWAEFDSTINFNRCHYQNKVFFFGSKFQDIANFSESTFDSLVNFSWCTFTVKADFSRSQFYDETRFNSSTLPDTILFLTIKSKKVINLTFCSLDSSKNQCFIDLTNSDLEKFRFSYDRFKVFFYDSTTTIPKRQNVYESLLKMQEKYGYRSGYEKADKEYKAFTHIGKFRLDPNASFLAIGIGTILNFIDKWWWDYGYSKTRIFLWTAGLYLLFVLWNVFYIYRGKLFNFYTPPFLQKYQALLKRAHRQKSIAIHFFSNVYISLIYTAYVFFGLKFEMSQLNYKRKWMVTFFFFQYTIGLICLGYLANTIIVGK